MDFRALDAWRAALVRWKKAENSGAVCAKRSRRKGSAAKYSLQNSRHHGSPKNIHRALSLVPQEVINFFDLDVELYLKDHEIRDFGREYRALSHPQIELLAGRVSALHGCYY